MAQIKITIFRITGRQLFFKVPERICKECDATAAIVKSVIQELGIAHHTNLAVKPWINNLISCLAHGSWHPPIVTINGKRFSQGHVLDPLKLKNHLSLLTKVSFTRGGQV